MKPYLILTAVVTVSAAALMTIHKSDGTEIVMKTGEIDSISFTESITVEYPIHKNINAATFWAGEIASHHSHNVPAPSAWDSDFGARFGLEDHPSIERDADGFPTDSRYRGIENPFYFALPYNDYSEIVYDGTKVDEVASLQSDYSLKFIPFLDRNGVVTSKTKEWRKESTEYIPWRNSTASWSGRSMVKGRWVRIRYNRGEWVYAQWLDAGPYHYDDVAYVFGSGDAVPRNQKSATGEYPHAGIELSPAVMLKLGTVNSGNQAVWNQTGVTIVDGSIEWQFVEDHHVPAGPWSRVKSDNTVHWE